MARINRSQARTIIDAAFAKGEEMQFKPLSVAVLDAGGHLIAFERANGASLIRPQIAIGKAASALALGISSRKIADMAAERPTFIASLGPISPAGLIPAAGGVIVVDSNGEPLGAVGVTGDTSDNDEICTLAGIAASGLAAQS
jgi:uncharacterized protein GlcG (DUF336 family)